MGTVKRTFSIPEEVSTKLDETIPNQERSKFITQTLDEVETWGPGDESVVETIRKIRQAQTV